jgi:hypothetical protein
MNIDGNILTYTGKTIELLDTIEDDDLNLMNNENKNMNYYPYQGRNMRKKLYDMHSAKNLRINIGKEKRNFTYNKTKNSINKPLKKENNNEDYNKVIDAQDILKRNKEYNEELENENKTISKGEINSHLQRLYEDYSKKLEKNKKLKSEKEYEEINKYSYTPKINDKSRKIVISNPKLNKPIQKRTNEIIKETNDKIYRMKKEITLNPKFTPQINYNNNIKIGEKVFERLYEPINKNRIENEIEKFIKAKQNLKNRKLTKEEKECSFHPQTYSNLNDNSKFDINKFIQKQNEYLFKSHSKKYNLKKNLELIEKKNNTFNPNFSFTSNSNATIKVNVQRQGESFIEKIDRMSYEYIGNKEKIKLLDSYYNNFSFNPEINYDYNDNYILRKSFNKSFSNHPKKMLKKSFSSDKMIVNDKQYVNHKYDHIVSKYFFDNDLIKRIDDIKNKKYIENMKKKEEKENEELKECTFTPKINSNYNFRTFNEKNYYSPKKEENSYYDLKRKKILYDSYNNKYMNTNYYYQNNNNENINSNSFY